MLIMLLFLGMVPTRAHAFAAEFSPAVTRFARQIDPACTTCHAVAWNRQRPTGNKPAHGRMVDSVYEEIGVHEILLCPNGVKKK
jgi:hypothetical protein